MYYVCAQLYLLPLILSISYYCVHSLSVSPHSVLPWPPIVRYSRHHLYLLFPFLETTECTFVSAYGSVSLPVFLPAVQHSTKRVLFLLYLSFLSFVFVPLIMDSSSKYVKSITLSRMTQMKKSWVGGCVCV